MNVGYIVDGRVSQKRCMNCVRTEMTGGITRADRG